MVRSLGFVRMRRRLIVTLVTMAAALALPSVAHAEAEVVDDSTPVTVTVDTGSIEQTLSEIATDIQAMNQRDDERRRQEIEEEQRELAGKHEEEAKSPELEELESINGSIGILIEQNNGEQPVESKALAAGRVSLVAYANASPTSQYAEYARGMLQKLGWHDHYCFLQDGQSSYVYVWGDLSVDGAGDIVGEASYVRWYWESNTVGYIMETGTGTVSVSPNSHTVLSDLGVFPALDSVEPLRREVMFYAVAACSVYCLHTVWSFLLRYRDAAAS